MNRAAIGETRMPEEQCIHTARNSDSKSVTLDMLPIQQPQAAHAKMTTKMLTASALLAALLALVIEVAIAGLAPRLRIAICEVATDCQTKTHSMILCEWP